MGFSIGADGRFTETNNWLGYKQNPTYDPNKSAYAVQYLDDLREQLTASEKFGVNYAGAIDFKKQIVSGAFQSGADNIFQLKSSQVNFDISKIASLSKQVNNVSLDATKNYIFGNSQNNNLNFQSFTYDSSYHIQAAEGNDEVRGGMMNDEIWGEYGNDELYGIDGNDVIYGNYGNDFLFGGGGDDLLFGGKGNDLLQGDKGDDILIGGIGKDTLNGGLGNDIFYVNANPTGDDITTIKDFNVGDKIRFLIGNGADQFNLEYKNFVSLDNTSDGYYVLLNDSNGKTIVKIEKSADASKENIFTAIEGAGQSFFYDYMKR